MQKLYLECVCHTELMQLEYEADDDILYMSYYTYSRKGNRYGIMNRLRHIWRIIRERHPYSDGIVLDRAEKEKRIKALNKFKRTHIVKKKGNMS